MNNDVTDTARARFVLRIVAQRRDLAARGLFAMGFLAALAMLVQPPHSPVPEAMLRFELPHASQAILSPDYPLPDPGALMPLTPQSARESNRLVAIETPVQAAPGFQLSPGLDETARDRATDCLAAAQWYEAGDDPSGERAVAQVVLNRVRHPTFPDTVCGVVFQGADRTSGCQFTFTCDGSLARRPSIPAWTRARAIAMAALAGAVDPRVGSATHYHADYVVPYWRASLVKTAQVGVHLFYRWPGAWGSADTLRRKTRFSEEPRIPALETISPAHGGADRALANRISGTALDEAAPAHVVAPSLAPPATLPNRADRVEFALDPAAFSGSYAMRALSLCAGKPRCVALGRVPSAGDRAPLGFLYVRDNRTGAEGAWWDCTIAPRDDHAQCLPRGPAQDRLVAQWL